MSSPRYDWWSYVKGMIRRYPQLAAEYAELHRPSPVPQGEGLGRSSGISRPTEGTALRELPPCQQKEYEAVHKALEIIKAYENGENRLRLVQLVFWQRSHSIEGAAQQLHISKRTALRWHQSLIRLVAQNYGLL